MFYVILLSFAKNTLACAACVFKDISIKICRRISLQKYSSLELCFRNLKCSKSITDNRVVLRTLTFTSRFHFSGEPEILAGDGCSTTVYQDDYLGDIKLARKSTRLSGVALTFFTAWHKRVVRMISVWYGESTGAIVVHALLLLSVKINEDVNVTESFIKISFSLTPRFSFNYNVNK